MNIRGREGLVNPSDTNIAASIVSPTRACLASVSTRRKCAAPLAKIKGLDARRRVRTWTPLAVRNLHVLEARRVRRGKETALAPRPRVTVELGRVEVQQLGAWCSMLGSGHPVAWQWGDNELARPLVFTARRVQCSILSLGLKQLMQ